MLGWNPGNDRVSRLLVAHERLMNYCIYVLDIQSFCASYRLGLASCEVRIFKSWDLDANSHFILLFTFHLPPHHQKLLPHAPI